LVPADSLVLKPS